MLLLLFPLYAKALDFIKSLRLSNTLNCTHIFLYNAFTISASLLHFSHIFTHVVLMTSDYCEIPTLVTDYNLYYSFI